MRSKHRIVLVGKVRENRLTLNAEITSVGNPKLDLHKNEHTTNQQHLGCLLKIPHGLGIEF
jgi:hypothetical protein